MAGVNAGEGSGPLISGIAEQPEGLGEAGLDRLLVQLAIYLEKYHPTVVFNGTTLDPRAIQKNRASYDLEDDAWTCPVSVDSSRLDIKPLSLVD